MHALIPYGTSFPSSLTHSVLEQRLEEAQSGHAQGGSGIQGATKSHLHHRKEVLCSFWCIFTVQPDTQRVSTTRNGCLGDVGQLLGGGGWGGPRHLNHNHRSALHLQQATGQHKVLLYRQSFKTGLLQLGTVADYHEPSLLESATVIQGAR
jgi:hypothetical protein